MILVISPEPWEGHFVSKHHYALEMVRRGHRVLFHGPPEAGPRRLEQVSAEGVGQLEVLRGPRVAPGLRLMPARLRRLLEARWLVQVERLAGARIEVVWLFENSRFFDMSFAGKRLKIYHQVDLNQNFNPKQAAASADNVFCSGSLILERLLPHNPTARFIHHGVQISPSSPEGEADLFDEAKLNCLYLGNLSMEYLDRDLLLKCVRAYPEMVFHFVGGFRAGDAFEAAVRKEPNVVLHGKVQSVRILSILENADILMVTYSRDHFADQSNPHKMMEYMMAGRVTVATYTKEYEPVADLLAMAGRDSDYVSLLGYVAEDIANWNRPEQVARRRAFASDNTYPRQLDRIAEALGPLGRLIS